ncbi:hypothetical protein LU604_03235 [Erwinia tracheiphila]|uniref:Type III secretion protein n=1 Tax=Erwinia tracheiphila TaxID=65700 RepID=A0A345CUT9_9GAMM|nr:hypothetical protein [Erwinia tracheiphila]AXF77206.1 hypothetical protein AV903_16105 [Erwinia tracheiphila]UIA84102.1 hypothetical protein LU604_03235 [Erwinia tracheiphila]UIA92684.1 hypothetical protein LU632_03205 [Erwinia tracheiphila]
MSGLMTGSTGVASKIMEGAMSHSALESAKANAVKIEMDTHNSIVDGKMDSASKEINSGHNASKSIQF